MVQDISIRPHDVKSHLTRSKNIREKVNNPRGQVFNNTQRYRVLVHPALPFFLCCPSLLEKSTFLSDAIPSPEKKKAMCFITYLRAYQTTAVRLSPVFRSSPPNTKMSNEIRTEASPSLDMRAPARVPL